MFSFFLISFVVFLMYRYITRNHDYWQKKGVIHVKPLPFFGNNLDFFLLKKNALKICKDYYQMFPNEKVIGYYRQNVPELIVKDPDILQSIFTSDFECFTSRGAIHIFVPDEPVMKNNMFLAEGDRWRLLRKQFNSAFSNISIKKMLPIMAGTIKPFQDFLEKKTENGSKIMNAIEITETMFNDIVGALYFGVENTERKEETKMVKWPLLQAAIINFYLLLPSKLQNVYFFKRSDQQTLYLFKKIMEGRNFEPTNRNDFVDYFLKIKKTGNISGKSMEEFDKDGTPKTVSLEIDDLLLSRQLFLFAGASFFTPSSDTAHILYQLARNPTVQKKTQEVIDRVLLKYNNDVCLEALQEMSYVDCVIKESLRMLPPGGGFLYRECTKKYTFKDLNLTIDPGVRIMIPTYSLHNDPKYFENPEQFCPERFEPGNDQKINKYVYLPFGEGPRICIGKNLGLVQQKIVLISILSKFNVKTTPKTQKNIELHPLYTVIQDIVGGIPLEFSRRKTK